MKKDLFYLFGFIENYYLTMRVNLRKVLIEILIEFVFLAELNTCDFLILVTVITGLIAAGLLSKASSSSARQLWVSCWLVLRSSCWWTCTSSAACRSWCPSPTPGARGRKHRTFPQLLTRPGDLCNNKERQTTTLQLLWWEDLRIAFVENNFQNLLQHFPWLLQGQVGEKMLHKVWQSHLGENI